ncbi:MAG: hypothetical protein ACN6I5_00980 [Hyphomicrobiales bacterium]
MVPPSIAPKGDAAIFNTLAIECIAGPDARDPCRALPGLPDDAFAQ